GGQRKRIADQRVRRGRIQYVQQHRYVEKAVKYMGVIEYPEQTDEIVHEAIRQALSGRPGPVYIDVPMNSMLAEVDLPPPPPPESYRLVKQGASAEAIRDAVALIQESEYPLLLVGHGAFAARGYGPIGELARNLQCAIIETFPQSPIVPGMEDRTFPFGFSPAGIDAIAKADLVIAIGTEIGEPVQSGTGGHWTKGNVDRKWIYIERDGTAFGVNRHIDVPLHGDLRDVVPQLVDALKDSPRKAKPELAQWIAAHAKHRAATIASAPPPSVPIHP